MGAVYSKQIKYKKIRTLMFVFSIFLTDITRPSEDFRILRVKQKTCLNIMFKRILIIKMIFNFENVKICLRLIYDIVTLEMMSTATTSTPSPSAKLSIIFISNLRLIWIG